MTQDQLDKLKELELTDEKRPALRRTWEWESCFSSWLAGERPSVAREWLAGPKEELLRFLDQRTWGYLALLRAEVEQAEAMGMTFPMWEEGATGEEIDQEDANRLTTAEQESLLAIAREAMGEGNPDE